MKFLSAHSAVEYNALTISQRELRRILRCSEKTAREIWLGGELTVLSVPNSTYKYTSLRFIDEYLNEMMKRQIDKKQQGDKQEQGNKQINDAKFLLQEAEQRDISYRATAQRAKVKPFF